MELFGEKAPYVEKSHLSHAEINASGGDTPLFKFCLSITLLLFLTVSIPRAQVSGFLASQGKSSVQGQIQHVMVTK